MEYRGKILVADDDGDIREVIRLLLTGEGYTVAEAKNGSEAVLFADDSFDLIILDVMMPDMNGFSACEQIRKNYVTPILFLTARTQDQDKIMGFSAGGDDYLSKPFSYSELVSRVKAMIRRYRDYGEKSSAHGKELYVGDIVINTDSFDVTVGGKNIVLTDIEYRILLLLAKHPGKVYSAQNIYESIWDEQYFYSANNTVMVHMRNLRKKLGTTSSGGEVIKTVWGKGYKV